MNGAYFDFALIIHEMFTDSLLVIIAPQACDTFGISTRLDGRPSQWFFKEHKSVCHFPSPAPSLCPVRLKIHCIFVGASLR